MPSSSQEFALVCVICGLKRWKMQINVNKCQTTCQGPRSTLSECEISIMNGSIVMRRAANSGLSRPKQASRKGRYVSVQIQMEGKVHGTVYTNNHLILSEHDGAGFSIYFIYDLRHH